MVTKAFVRKVVANMPDVVYAKRNDFRAKKKKNGDIVIYRYVYEHIDETKELAWEKFITIPVGTLESGIGWIHHVKYGNQYYDKYGAAKVGGSNGRYPGCGIGGSPQKGKKYVKTGFNTRKLVKGPD